MNIKYNDAVQVTGGFYEGMKGYAIFEQGDNYIVKLITNIEDMQILFKNPEYIEATINKSLLKNI